MIQNTQKKIAIVVQRCGKSIAAGAEVYAYELAKALSQSHTTHPLHVDIYSSQSDDYIAWNNNLPKEESVNPYLKIIRFPVLHSRLMTLFRITRRISFFLGKHFKLLYYMFAPFLDYLFLKTQGPWCPELWNTLLKNSSDYSLVIVKSYLYAPNVKLTLSLKNKVKVLFIVTAHDEPEFKFKFVGDCIKKADVLGSVSYAEKELCEKIWPLTSLKPHYILPPGIVPPLQHFEEEQVANKIRPVVSTLLSKKFFLCLGRIDKNKNIPFLFANTPANHLVVFAGEKHLCIPDDPRFLYLGKVSDEEKFVLLKNALALLMVSRFEAYSIVTAEALSLGCLVLALKGCAPVDELIERYGGLSIGSENYALIMRDIVNETINLEKFRPKSELIMSEKSWEANVEKILKIQ